MFVCKQKRKVMLRLCNCVLLCKDSCQCEYILHAIQLITSNCLSAIYGYPTSRVSPTIVPPWLMNKQEHFGTQHVTAKAFLTHVSTPLNMYGYIRSFK